MLEEASSFKLWKFQGENFQMWRFGMKNLLAVKGLWDATAKAPSVDTKDDQASKAFGLLISNLDQTQWLKYTDEATFKDAKTVWDDLEAKYGTISPISAALSLGTLVRFTITEGESYMDAFNSMDNLRQQVVAGGI